MSSSSSVPPHGAQSPDEVIAQLQQQLAKANHDGRQILAMLEAEKAKVAQHAVASQGARGQGIKVPNVPFFKGEVGFTVDAWLRRLDKHFDFYGSSVFPDEASRIKYATMHLDGPATDWWDTLPAGDKLRIATWQEFVDAMHSRFRPLQASLVARHRLSALKQTHSVAAYATLFQKELTPISDMSDADQVHYFRAGLKSVIGQRVLEKMPKNLHEAIDVAVLADAYGAGRLNSSLWQGAQRNSSFRAHAPRAESDNNMDLTMIEYSSGDEAEPSGPVGNAEHESVSSSSSAPKSQISSLMREFQKMKAEVKKFQTQASISALANSAGRASSPGGSGGSRRVAVSKEEFDHCWNNHLCLKCKKPGHIARDCSSSTVQHLKR
jgi:hypothetical protein